MKLESLIDKTLPYFEITISGITLEQLSAFAIASRLNIKKFMFNYKYIVPKDMLPILVDHLVEEFNKKYNDFPIKKYHHVDKSDRASRINQIFIDQELIILIQKLSILPKDSLIELSCKIEVICKETIMLNGIYSIFGKA
jgi:hypothetical protein